MFNVKCFLQENAGIEILASNWRPIMLCGLLLASKVWQDLSTWNVEFESISPDFTLKSINRLERTFLKYLRYSLFISGTFKEIEKKWKFSKIVCHYNRIVIIRSCEFFRTWFPLINGRFYFVHSIFKHSPTQCTNLFYFFYVITLTTFA